jgi:preprotein translocase subunit SecE
MAKTVSDKSVAATKAPAPAAKAPAPASSSLPAKAPAKKSTGLKNPFSRSSSPAKTGTAPRGAVSAKPVGRIRTFLREVRIEMSKVTWPPRKELITATGVVIVAVIIAGVYIGVLDFIWQIIVRAVGLG